VGQRQGGRGPGGAVSGPLPPPIPPIITLLTDFGSKDSYVGVMKGVILGINPAARLVDLTHEVEPQNVAAGSWLLAAAAPDFPPGTIHLAVVDPGVGTDRRGLAAWGGGQFWVGPDNGLFSPLFQEREETIVVSLESPEYFRHPVSATFHGRDILAPVAAHLSRGVPVDDFGPRITDPVVLTRPQPFFTSERVQGEIIYLDHFGNLVSNIRGRDLLAWLAGKTPVITLGPLKIRGLARTYGNLPPGEFLALVGSHGCLEVARVRGHAGYDLKVGQGTPLTITKT